MFSFPLLNVSMCVCLYVCLYVCLCVRECVKRAEQFQLLRLQSAGKMQTCPGTKRRRRQRWTGKRVCWKIREWVMERELADGGCSWDTILASAANQKQTKKATTNKTGQLKLLPPSLLTSRKFLCTGHTLQSREREKERNGARECIS